MLTLWTRIGGAVVLVFVLGLLTKGIADVGELKGTVNVLVSRVDSLQTEMNSRFVQIEGRFVQIENRMGQIESRMETRLVRIENILMGRAPDADDAVSGPDAASTVSSRPAARNPR